METDDLVALAGRLLLATIFLASAFGKITNFDGTVMYMDNNGLPAATFLCVLAVVVEAMGAMSLLLGFHARLGAAVLAGFVVAATLVFHVGPEQRIHMLKNIAIIGGLLQVVAFGPGKMSFEGRRS